MATSLYFWAFVALMPIVFWSIKREYRFILFSLLSILVISYFDALSAIILLAIVAAIHVGVRLQERGNDLASRWFLATSIAILVALIGWKLAIAQKILLSTTFDIGVWLPLGISYFSFKAIHFIIEFHRGKIAKYDPALLVSYMFIPTAFSAGPIQRYDRFVAEMSSSFEMEHVYQGVTRITYGLIKQFIIVDIIINIDTISGDQSISNFLNSVDTYSLWVHLTLFYIVLYLNFSAYTDIAIGTSRLFGFVIMENFNWPILARSIDDFWRRWHMTLTGWCREYVYQPILGLTRRPMLASYGTFVVIGLWHDLTLSRLLWGVLHGTALVLYFAWKRKFHKPVRRSAAKSRSVASVASTVSGWVATQLFVIASMCALLVEGNDVVQIGRLFLRLVMVDV